jgi:nicotinate-nucleotide pyrophosphorylase (carboxylating)
MYLIKENHIAAAGGIPVALERVLSGRVRGKEIEVEVRNLNELEAALKYPIDRVMLDNFTPEEVGQAISRIDSACKGRKRPGVEVSGRVEEDNIGRYCVKGVDYISVGSLTHSVRSLDISMILGGR